MSSGSVENDATVTRDAVNEDVTTTGDASRDSRAPQAAADPSHDGATYTDLHNEDKVEYEPVEEEQVASSTTSVEEVGPPTSSDSDAIEVPMGSTQEVAKVPSSTTTTSNATGPASSSDRQKPFILALAILAFVAVIAVAVGLGVWLSDLGEKDCCGARATDLEDLEDLDDIVAVNDTDVADLNSTDLLVELNYTSLVDYLVANNITSSESFVSGTAQEQAARWLAENDPRNATLLIVPQTEPEGY
jgi:hypothetical protein